MSRQRIISMTSKGVVISRPFLPISLRSRVSPRVGLRVAAASHPCDRINPTVPPPPRPFTSLLDLFSSPTPPTRGGGGGGWPSSVIHPPTRDPLLKHDFRRQTKRASVVYNEARSFVSSPLFQASSPSSTHFCVLRLPSSSATLEYGRI